MLYLSKVSSFFFNLDLGGGKIKRNNITIVLILFCFVLSLSMSSAMATNNTTNTTQNTSEIAAGSTSTAQAAGSTTTVTVTISQLNQSASNVKNFIDTNKRLPNYVTIAGQRISTPQFLQLLSQGIVNLNTGSTSPITLKNVNTATTPSQTVKSGTLTKTEYVKLATSLNTFINTNGRLPNYLTSSLGKIRYESLIYSFSKVLIFYGNNNRLPNTVTIAPWSSSSGTGDMSQYLQATEDAPSTSSTIKSLANSITTGLTSTYDKAEAIFNWVRDNLTYSYYYNTKKGALGALSSRTANCCDHSHLVVALARAAGIPARYQHGTCKFGDGWFGHVWAQLYVDGSWYYADAISDYNSFGAINNWDLNSYTLKGTYAELPF
jgi:hypothetical protein